MEKPTTSRKRKLVRFNAYNIDNCHTLSFHSYDDVNVETSAEMKAVALKATNSIVGVGVYSGDKQLFFCSGMIIESRAVDNNSYHGRILTSAVFMMNDPSASLRVLIYLRCGKICDGRIMAISTAYCMLLLDIESTVPLSPISFKEIDDLVRVGSNELDNINSFELRPHQEKIKLIHGEMMVALGRSSKGDNSLMCAAGPFSIECCCNLDRHELIHVRCRISQAGIGGPMLNGKGDLLGMNFYSQQCTPFLPSNVILKWLEHQKRNLEFPLPRLGLQVANLYTASEGILQRVLQQFPDTSSGVIVNASERGFGMVKLRVKDVIVECSGRRIGSVFQLLDIAREKVNECVELVVLRPAKGVRLRLSGVLAEKEEEELESWRLPDKCFRLRRRVPNPS